MVDREEMRETKNRLERLRKQSEQINENAKRLNEQLSKPVCVNDQINKIFGV